jgi:hypothetical protein
MAGPPSATGDVSNRSRTQLRGTVKQGQGSRWTGSNAGAKSLAAMREEHWCCSGGPPHIAIVQTAHLRNTDHPSLCGRLHRPRLGRVLLQRQVTAAVMVQLINTIPIALIRGKFITLGILGTAARSGSTKSASGVGSRLFAVVWNRHSVRGPWRYHGGCWKQPAVPTFTWWRLHVSMAPHR